MELNFLTWQSLVGSSNVIIRNLLRLIVCSIDGGEVRHELDDHNDGEKITAITCDDPSAWEAYERVASEPLSPIEPSKDENLPQLARLEDHNQGMYLAEVVACSSYLTLRRGRGHRG